MQRFDQQDPIRVMVVDDSLTARTVLRKIIENAEDLILSETANSAEQALEKLHNVEVDVILLDLEMPGMGGLAALPELLASAGEARIMIVSALTAEGAKVTMTALSMGAADTIQKPQVGEFDTEYRTDLANRIRALGPKATSANRSQLATRSAQPKVRKANQNKIKSLAIGASTGGIHSMCQFLKQLPKSFQPAIQITQHLPASFMPIFANQIALASSRKTQIAADDMPVLPGEILIAPGDGHLSFTMKQDRPVVKILRHKVANGCCPSVDPMFESLADTLNGETIGVLLSGMGRDGLQGAEKIVAAGGIILAECPETCAVWGMPRGVAEAGLASAVASPEDLANWIGSRNLVTT